MTFNGRPDRTKIPEDTKPADVLFALQMFIYEYKDDLRFTRALRITLSALARFSAVAVPIGLLALAFITVING